MPEKTPPKAPTPAPSSTPPSASSRKIGYNSNGVPEKYPSDMQSYQTQYGLTAPEAEALWERTVVGSENPDTVAEELRTSRVTYRVRYEQVTNNPDNALTAVQIAAARQLEQAKRDEEVAKSYSSSVTTPTSDRTQPEAGPYGPHAEYETVTLPVEEVAHAANLTPAQVKEANL